MPGPFNCITPKIHGSPLNRRENPCPRTLYDKMGRARRHTAGTAPIDRHLVHGDQPANSRGLRLATASPGARLDGRDRRSQPPTTGWDSAGRIADPTSTQVETLDANIKPSARRVFPLPRQAPGHRPRDQAGQGATLPGMTVVCGDSHTSTHGAFGGACARHRHQRGRARAGTRRPCSAKKRRTC